MRRFERMVISSRKKGRRKPRRSRFRKQHAQGKIQEIHTSWSSSTSFSGFSKMEDMKSEATDDEVSCTPKAPRFQLPEVSACPPAPKKARRVLLSDCSLLRSQIAFFAPPELEL